MNIRMRELERKQKEEEDNNGSMNTSSHQLIQNTSSTNSNHNSIHSDAVTQRPRDTRSFNSRRSSTDSSEDGMKQEVRDMEEKFRKAMVANASLDNEKSQLMFQA